MGVEPPGPAGNDCVDCWAAGETPKKIFVAYSDIKIGNLWVPGDPGAPNGTFELVQNVAVACLWQYNVANNQVAISIGMGITRYTNRFFGGAITAFVKNAGPCTFFAVNQIQTPIGQKFYGGTVTAWTA